MDNENKKVRKALKSEHKSDIELALEGKSPENFSAKEHYEETTGQDPEDIEIPEYIPTEDEILAEKEIKDQGKQTAAFKATKHYFNGINEWKLISESRNDLLGWRSTTTAMNVPDLGVVLCTREGLDSKLSVSTTVLHDCVLEEIDCGEDKKEMKWVVYKPVD